MTKMLKEIFEQPGVFSGIEKANRETLLKLVAELKEREIDHAVFAARGTSRHAAIYGQYLLGVYKGVVSAIAAPSIITVYDGKLSLGRDLVVGISQSGKAADGLAVLKQANECGALTVAITNNPESPMAKEAKYHLYCAAGEEVSVAATKTFTAQMFLLALLTAYWSDNLELLDGLRDLPFISGEMIKECRQQIEDSTRVFKFMKEGIVLARGFCYPIALEAALKIQETCYVKMKGYAISDFYHGPLAQVDPETPVIVLAPSGKAMSDAEDMIERIREIGAQPFVVTDSAALAEKAGFALTLPGTGNEATQAFLFAIFVQIFAQALSVSKGLNPDEPRALKKVTITR